jgi:hypothetical protein
LLDRSDADVAAKRTLAAKWREDCKRPSSNNQKSPPTANAALRSCLGRGRARPRKTVGHRVGSRAHISTVTLRFSPSFGSSPVNFALANSKAATAALAGPPSEARSVSGIRRNRWTLPPKLVGLSPEHVRLGGIAHNAGATGDRQVSFVFRIDEDKADDIGRGFDLILLCTVNVGHEKDQASVAVGPFARAVRRRIALSACTPRRGLCCLARSCQCICPAKHPSPKKPSVPRSVTAASFPDSERTVFLNLRLAFHSRHIRMSEGSNCAYRP